MLNCTVWFNHVGLLDHEHMIHYNISVAITDPRSLFHYCRSYKLWGADHCTGRPELRRAGNSSGMLSPSADQYSGHIAMRDCAACSTFKSKETLSPSVDHCCGLTVRHEWRRWSSSAEPLLWSDCKAWVEMLVSLRRPLLWSDCKAWVEMLVSLRRSLCPQMDANYLALSLSQQTGGILTFS